MEKDLFDEHEKEPDRKIVAQLNDELRKYGRGGKVMITRDVQSLGEDFISRIVQTVREFDDFNPDNDPYKERDCATLEVDSEKILWKIDYYDLEYKHHSPDKSNPEVTNRVLTIMLAYEY